MFLQNICSLSTHYKAVHPRKQNSSRGQLLHYWAMWKITGKTVEQQCYIRNALDGTAHDILEGNSDLNCPDLNRNLRESVNSECETACTTEEDSEKIKFI
jgi:hypothetical protein